MAQILGFLTYFQPFQLNLLEKPFSGIYPLKLTRAHTLGETNAEFSGFSGNWVDDELCLDNQYYNDMIRRNWIQVNARNATDPRWQWSVDGVVGNNMMLNADICLWIDIDPNAIGIVSTTFNETEFSLTSELVLRFAKDNALWLKEFAQVFTKMITTTPEKLVPARGAKKDNNTIKRGKKKTARASKKGNKKSKKRRRQ